MDCRVKTSSKLNNNSIEVCVFSFVTILSLAQISTQTKASVRVSQNELLTCLWYLNLECILKGLGVILKFNNNDNDDED